MRIHGICAVFLILPVTAGAAGIVSTIDAPDNDIIGLAWQDDHLWAVDRMVVGAATGEALRGESTFSLDALPYTVFSFFYGYSLGPSLR